MTPRRGPKSLADDRSVLSGTRDVSVGAYARRQQRRRLAVGGVGLVLIGGSAWLLKLLWPAGGPVSGQHPVLVQCLLCGRQEAVSAGSRPLVFPLMCGVCKQRSCHEVWQCRECDQRFLPRSPTGVVRCPQCGSDRVGAAETPGSRPDAPRPSPDAPPRGPEAPRAGPEALRANGRYMDALASASTLTRVIGLRSITPGCGRGVRRPKPGVGGLATTSCLRSG